MMRKTPTNAREGKGHYNARDDSPQSFPSLTLFLFRTDSSSFSFLNSQRSQLVQTGNEGETDTGTPHGSCSLVDEF